VNTSSTALKYHNKSIKNIKRIESIVTATKRNIFEVIKLRATTIIIGKLRNIMKFIITRILRKSIRRCSFTVVFKFKIAIRIDIQRESNTHLFWRIISYLA
jgi:hypothetical protein